MKEIRAVGAGEHFTNEEFMALPMIVVVSTRHENRYYGPFRNGVEAQAWCQEQEKAGGPERYGMLPLRTPNLDRSYDDWWTPDQFRSDDRILEDFGISPGHGG